MIKKDLKDNVEKTKRQKTVITGTNEINQFTNVFLYSKFFSELIFSNLTTTKNKGDIKPIIESLQLAEKPQVQVISNEKGNSQEVLVLSKRQVNELNKERQASKSIQRESIRNRKAY